MGKKVSKKTRTEVHKNQCKFRKLKRVFKSCGPKAAEEYAEKYKTNLSSFKKEIEELREKHSKTSE
jgi:hypothetical protein